MKKSLIILFSLIMLSPVYTVASENNFSHNRAPLKQKAYAELPLTSIKPKGWLYEMLDRQRKGATGHMDQLYPVVMSERNGWLGGDGDQWERGPYWIDGLLPLSYLLDDKELQQKVQPWIEWSLKNQRTDGFFGPEKDYPHEEGIQRDNSHDWWPRMVMLKIMQQYYSATHDKRIIDFMTRYFKYQLATLPEKPLGHWTFWGEYRACDNLQAVYWLYNITGEPFLLQLGELIHKQSYDFTGVLLKGEMLTHTGSIHCVNLAQGIKEPAIYYQQSGDIKHLAALKKGFADIRKFNGQAQGMYGGDEGLHGNNPTQGVELCSVVEMMYSLEHIFQITGDLSYADHLEKITFNALPTQITDDFMDKQYFQQANQVMATRHIRNFYEDFGHGGTDVVYGTISGYACCYSNMHQGWPKFTSNLWYSTPDGGLACMLFSPSEVTTKVKGGAQVRISEETNYPFGDNIKFTIHLDKKSKSVDFPFHLRIPGWCEHAEILLNGEKLTSAKGGQIEIIDRVWKSGDRVELNLPMKVQAATEWHENSISIERGPLVYALKIEEQWEKKQFPESEHTRFGEEYWEVRPMNKWNYGLLPDSRNKPDQAFEVVVHEDKLSSSYPWNLENAPIELKTKAREIPHWQLYNEMAGPLPISGNRITAADEEEITLIPYGCTTLRIAQFPIVW